MAQILGAQSKLMPNADYHVGSIALQGHLEGLHPVLGLPQHSGHEEKREIA